MSVAGAVQDERGQGEFGDPGHVGAEVGRPGGDAGEGGVRGGAGRGVPARPDRLLADAAAQGLVEVVERLVEVGEVGVTVLAHRGRDLLEDPAVHPVRVVVRLEQVRLQAGQEGGLGHPLRAVRGQIAADLTAAHREADQDRVAQVEGGHQGVQVGGERVVVEAGGRPAGAAETAAVVGDHPVPRLQQGRELLLPGVPVQRIAVDQDHRLSGGVAVVLVVELDVGAVLAADGHQRHVLISPGVVSDDVGDGGAGGTVHRPRTRTTGRRRAAPSGRAAAAAPAGTRSVRPSGPAARKGTAPRRTS